MHFVLSTNMTLSSTTDTRYYGMFMKIGGSCMEKRHDNVDSFIKNILKHILVTNKTSFESFLSSLPITYVET